MSDLVVRVRAIVRQRVEAMPYPWLHQDDDETLRSFFESTWQGSNADEVFEAAADVAARAAIAEVLDEVERHLSAVQYDPAPYTALKHRLAQFKAENVKTDQGWTGEGSSLPPLGLIGPK